MATQRPKALDGGNSYGVCRGLDQGGKLQDKKHLSQDFHIQDLGFYIGNK